MTVQTVQPYEKTAEGKLKCPDCDKVFDRPQDVGRHRAVAHGYRSPKHQKRRKVAGNAAKAPGARVARVQIASIMRTWAPELATRQSFGKDGAVLIAFAGGDIFIGRPAEVRQKATANAVAEK